MTKDQHSHRSSKVCVSSCVEWITPIESDTILESWRKLGVCVCQRSVLRGGAQSLEILSHMQSGGNGVCFVRVCVCCYHLGKSLFCHVIGKHPLHSIGGLMSYDGIRCRGKLFWHVCVFLLCSESRLHAA